MKSNVGGSSEIKRKAANDKSIRTTLYDLLDAMDREIKDDQLVRQIVMQLLASGKIKFTQNVDREMVFA